MISLSNDEKYDIMCNENAEYNDKFYIAVKTTGIYCKPSCTAKKPKKENVEFFDTAFEAEVNGYRPCKVCFQKL